MCQAEYVRKIEAPPDWGIIFESPPKSHDQDESSVYSLVRESGEVWKTFENST